MMGLRRLGTEEREGRKFEETQISHCAAVSREFQEVFVVENNEEKEITGMKARDGGKKKNLELEQELENTLSTLGAPERITLHCGLEMMH